MNTREEKRGDPKATAEAAREDERRAGFEEKTGVATTPELPAQGEAKHAGKEGAGPTSAARVSVPSDERREGPALIAVHLERIFIDPLTRKPLTLDELRRALCGEVAPSSHCDDED